ncbi:hypothetical protein DDZ14_18025 [Maritimibacter sp. 55A14]|uniref:hypothetical protein n=1 Tax=Maritimibacter sp. 55A14 TaxID=2174844 RepID=UPI000D60CAB6|nr:hypothetical protein [Maritimibacter sp. 55A14]PWE29268.1 hypothetical protein DDZ14_18025 [Maritimibacter sp. 55A14]
MIVVAGLLIAFVLVILFSNRATRACRWRADRRGDRPRATKYRCAACGAEAWTENGKPPRICMAHEGPK